mmetsp:Transcript_14958/g.46350  ORF Transcript_14958/g.46350 Transcript_14958/m.46350 type:complete len:269 (+) Transcript_14958:422-1228(+)
MYATRRVVCSTVWSSSCCARSSNPAVRCCHCIVPAAVPLRPAWWITSASFTGAPAESQPAESAGVAPPVAPVAPSDVAVPVPSRRPLSARQSSSTLIATFFAAMSFRRFSRWRSFSSSSCSDPCVRVCSSWMKVAMLFACTCTLWATSSATRSFAGRFKRSCDRAVHFSSGRSRRVARSCACIRAAASASFARVSFVSAVTSLCRTDLRSFTFLVKLSKTMRPCSFSSRRDCCCDWWLRARIIAASLSSDAASLPCPLAVASHAFSLL